MDLGLKDRVAVVFAASRGLGRASARALAKEGCRLAICARGKEELEKTASELRDEFGVEVLAETVDVCDGDSISSFAAKVQDYFGTVNVLVNNGGGPPPGTFEQLNESDFRAATDLLLMNVVRSTYAFLPLIKAADGPRRILSITSVSVLEALPNLILSNSLRSAVNGWSKSVAKELAPHGILVNCVAPGIVHTDRIDQLVEANMKRSGSDRDVVVSAMESKIPLGRFGKPEEFGAAVAFLASEQASYISGVTLYVDAAMSGTIH